MFVINPHCELAPVDKLAIDQQPIHFTLSRILVVYTGIKQ